MKMKTTHAIRGLVSHFISEQDGRRFYSSNWNWSEQPTQEAIDTVKQWHEIDAELCFAGELLGLDGKPVQPMSLDALVSHDLKDHSDASMQEAIKRNVL